MPSRASGVEHLDIIDCMHHDASVRTTLTIDDDLLDRVRALAERRKASIKDTLNDVIRRGLSAQELRSRRRAKFHVESFRSPFRPGIDPSRLNQLVDDLDVSHAADRVRKGGA